MQSSMALFRVSQDVTALYSQLFTIKPRPMILFRSAGTQHGNDSAGSHNKMYECFPQSTVHPLVAEDKHSFKVDFTNQGKRMMYSIKHFYEDFTGNSDVKKAQSKVGDLQHKIDIVMEKRSISECELIEVKKQLADLNSSQQDVTREDVDYLDLLKKEFKIHSQKQRLEGLIEVQNYEHQLLLMQLTHALNEVHAKERHEANTLRLIKLCLTTLVAVMGFVGNAGYNHYKDAKVQNHMKLQSTILQTLLEHAEEEKSRKANVSTESWGSYLYRQPGRFYGYMFPKQCSESWGSTVYRQSGRLYRYFFPKDS